MRFCLTISNDLVIIKTMVEGINANRKENEMKPSNEVLLVVTKPASRPELKIVVPAEYAAKSENALVACFESKGFDVVQLPGNCPVCGENLLGLYLEAPEAAFEHVVSHMGTDNDVEVSELATDIDSLT